MSAELSRVARAPIKFDNSVKIESQKQDVYCALKITGPKGSNVINIPNTIHFSVNDNVFSIVSSVDENKALPGTMRALVCNAIEGVTNEFKKKLIINGTGYRAQIKGNILNLSLGFSHPVEFKIPNGVNIVTPSQTEIEVSSVDKQLLGAVCADIRSYRPPEPYKGKGIKYEDEKIQRKEVDKK